MLTPATDAFRRVLSGVLPAAAFRDLTEAYLHEPRGRFEGTGGILVAPGSTEEVAAVVRACAEARVGIVPYGGGTGLVGGQIAEDGPPCVILSLERMDKIRALHPEENMAIVDAGAILQNVQEAAEAAGRLFPLTLASQGSARIGGNLATNAGGVNVLRYGNARDLCLGIEAVMPDGSIMNGLSGLRKDNTGYDLRHLLIGAEGTLGIITGAALKLFPRPAEIGAALMVVRDPDAALGLLSLAGDIMGGTVSAFELIHRAGLDFLEETGLDARAPFDDKPEWMVLIDVGMAAGGGSQERLETLFAEGFERGLVSDGVVAQSLAQRQAFWNIRETIPEANRRIGSVSSHDISIPIRRIPEFIQRGAQEITRLGNFRINCFGHLGDGNLHYNVFPQPGKTRADHADDRWAVKRLVHDLTHEFGGSVSAEHGIGRLKVGDLEKYGDPAKIAAIKAIKKALDPHGIMNPGAVVPG